MQGVGSSAQIVITLGTTSPYEVRHHHYMTHVNFNPGYDHIMTHVNFNPGYDHLVNFNPGYDHLVNFNPGVRSPYDPGKL